MRAGGAALAAAVLHQLDEDVAAGGAARRLGRLAILDEGGQRGLAHARVAHDGHPDARQVLRLRGGAGAAAPKDADHLYTCWPPRFALVCHHLLSSEATWAGAAQPSGRRARRGLARGAITSGRCYRLCVSIWAGGSSPPSCATVRRFWAGPRRAPSQREAVKTIRWDEAAFGDRLRGCWLGARFGGMVRVAALGVRHSVDCAGSQPAGEQPCSRPGEPHRRTAAPQSSPARQAGRAALAQPASTASTTHAAPSCACARGERAPPLTACRSMPHLLSSDALRSAR
jgi:hypothetical protein